MSQQDIQKQVEDAIQQVRLPFFVFLNHGGGVHMHALQLVNPFKEKQQLVEQLQTQIVDLERFVSYLQAENSGSSEGSTPVKVGC